jgi:hypothetical protein
MAIKGLKTTYKVGDTLVGGLTAINGIELTKEAVETTTLDKDYRTYRGGLKDGGEVTLEGYYAPGDVGQIALKTAFENDDDQDHVITFPTGAKWTFKGVVTSILPGGNANLDDNLAFAATIKVSGKPEFTEGTQV